MKKALLILTITLTAMSLTAQNVYWVFLTDKAGTTFDPYSYFDAKAIERYRMNGVSLYDSTNFPLNGGYVSQVEGVCEDFVGESRWLNAVGVGATPEQIAVIAEMPFVSRIRVTSPSCVYVGSSAAISSSFGRVSFIIRLPSFLQETPNNSSFPLIFSPKKG